MKIKQIAVTIMLSALGLSFNAAPLFAAQLTDHNKQFLVGYDKVHHALVTDDLTGAKAAAKDLGADGNDIANAASMKDARAAFEKLTAKAKQLASGQSGYHVYHCPMLNKDWVQTSATAENPYGGKDMVSCGEIQK